MRAHLESRAEHASMIAEAISLAVENAENDCGNTCKLSLWLLLIDAAARDIARLLAQDAPQNSSGEVAP